MTQLLTPQQVAAILQKPVGTLKRWRVEGSGPHLRTKEYPPISASFRSEELRTERLGGSASNMMQVEDKKRNGKIYQSVSVEASRK